MKPSSSIPDELLSAYLDQQVSDAERRRVEMALAGDPILQERLEALQSVVHLLQNTPAVVVPHPMTITEGQALAAGAYVAGVKKPGFWQRWMPKLAPAATAIIGVLFFLSLFATSPGMNTVNMSVSQESEAPAAYMIREVPVERAAQPTVLATALVEKSMDMPAPQARSMPEPTSAPPIERTEAPVVALEAAEAQVGAAAMEEESVARDAEKEESEAAGEEEKTSEPSEHEASPAIPSLLSPISWVLGAILILLLILTWRVTIAERRK